MSDFIITWQTCEFLLENFQLEIPDKNKKYECGGIISLSSLPSYQRKFLGYRGLMAWFGLTKNNKLKLFFEDDVSYDPNKAPCTPGTPICLPNHENLVESKRILERKNLGLETNKKLRGFNLKDVGNKHDSKSPKDTIVNDAIIKFKKDFPKENGNEFNKYPYAFFEVESQGGDVNSFLNQDGLSKIAYFFGFDDSSPAYINTNRIRVILVGLNENGDILVQKNVRGGLNKEIMILQNSWPPNP